MESQSTGAEPSDLKPPPGLMLFVVCSVLIVVSFILSIIGQKTDLPWLRFIGLAGTIAFAFLAAFGVARWQLVYFRKMPASEERLWDICLVIFAVTIGGAIHFLL